MGKFFKVWFVFVFTLVICVWVAVGFGVYKAFEIVSNPNQIGEYVGKIERGYNDAR